GERGERGLRRDVQRDVLAAGEDPGGQDVDDRRVVAGAEVLERLLDQEERSPQVHVVGLGQRVRGDRTDREGEGVGGVVDDHVDSAELLDGGADEPCDGVEVAHVGGYRQRGAAGPADGGGRLVARVGLAARHHDPGTDGGETLGHRPADPPAAPGDPGHPVRQVEGSQQVVSGHRVSWAWGRPAPAMRWATGQRRSPVSIDQGARPVLHRWVGWVDLPVSLSESGRSAILWAGSTGWARRGSTKWTTCRDETGPTGEA